MAQIASRGLGAIGSLHVFFVVCIVFFVITDPASSKSIKVREGQKIQAAIDAAKPGDVINVQAGEYPEQLVITKNDIQLIGHRASLIAPTTQVANNCSAIHTQPGVHAGICIFASGVVFSSKEIASLPMFEVSSIQYRVKDVSISGFEIRGFSGYNIAVVGGENVRVTKNKLFDSRRYGFLTLASKNTQVIDNSIISTIPLINGNFDAVALVAYDVSPIKVSDNRISRSFIALSIATSGAVVRDNKIDDSYTGAYFQVNTSNVQMHNNKITAPSKVYEFPMGIVLDGSSNCTIENNEVRGLTCNDPAQTCSGGSMLIFDGVYRDYKGDIIEFVVNGNVIKRNTFLNNDVDIVNLSAGANVIKNNKCTRPDCS